MSRAGNFGGRLYRGEAAFDFVGRRRTWYAISGTVLVLAALALGFLRLDFGVEFTGGTVVTFRSEGTSQSEVHRVTQQTVDVGQVTVQQIAGTRWRVETESLSVEQVAELRSAYAEQLAMQPNSFSQQVVGPSWGRQISRQMLIGLGVFLALLAIYLSIVFEWKMASAAIVALLHDIVVTAGLYAVIGFEVTPATVIGMLTILGYSLYDTVVVFDKVRENTAGLLGGSRMTFSQAANRAVNQVLMRSINTTVFAVLPVAGILFVGAGLLGAGPLKDFALVLFIGMAAGAYSSIFIATPFLADLKEREPQMQALARRVEARRGGGVKEQPAVATAGASTTPGGGSAQENGTAATNGASEKSTARHTGGSGRTPVGVGAGRVVQEGPRQQPRKGGSKKRPSGKKKR